MTAKVFFLPPSLPFNTAEIIQRREERAARRSLPADIVLSARARVCVSKAAAAEFSRYKKSTVVSLKNQRERKGRE